MAEIIAIGGGGFSHGTDPQLDDFVVAQSPVPGPNIGYIGAASGDDPVRIARFHQRFAATRCTPSHLPMASPPGAARDWIAAQHIIYVGGGDTGRLLAGWRASGLAEALCEAARTGIVLAGVSAGGMCWFEFALSDSGGAGLRPLAGLGLAAGSCCPHYSTEPHRQQAFRDQVATGELPDGIAIDDGVAVLISPGRAPVACSARPGAWAYRVSRDAGQARTARLAAAG